MFHCNVCCVIGTSNYEGEEVACRGRIILLEVNWAMGVTERGNVKLLKTKFYSKQEKGAVTAITQIGNFLVLCIGPKVCGEHKSR